jgi:regulator of RNase E activity RraA
MGVPQNEDRSGVMMSVHDEPSRTREEAVGAMEQLDEDSMVERVLRWAMIEHGSAGLSDSIGSHVIAPSPPSRFIPGATAIAGRVVLFRRQRVDRGTRSPSSFPVVRRHVTPGCVVLVRCPPGIGAGFGSNIVLQAAACRAQAIVTDGSWRDTTRLESVGLPVGANGANPTRPAGCPVVSSESEDMFGLVWNAGDWFLRDADGVLRLDDDLARRTASSLAATASGELASLLAPAEPVGEQ